MPASRRDGRDIAVRFVAAQLRDTKHVRTRRRLKRVQVDDDGELLAEMGPAGALGVR